ncbi:MAG TPA: PIG-L family deacetylase [Usitatibacteraceae bacterium]|nr:PIG-L family deacetylase [Usitatibacteraceae bacterium]
MSHDLAYLAYRYLFPRWIKNPLERSIVELERFHKPETVELPPGRRVLVLAPHPDDECVGCGGTVRKYVESNASVRVVILTDGRDGDPAVRQLARNDPERERLEGELAVRRKAETAASLRILGAEQGYFLDAADGQLQQHVAPVAARLAGILSEWRPDIVLLPFLTDRHADHFAANRCLIEAVSRLEPAWAESMNCLGYETWSPIYANVYVDISSTVDCKLRALNCHESQLPFADFHAGVEGLNRYRAVTGMTGGTHAEAFFLAPLSTYRRLYHNLLL